MNQSYNNTAHKTCIYKKLNSVKQNGRFSINTELYSFKVDVYMTFYVLFIV